MPRNFLLTTARLAITLLSFLVVMPCCCAQLQVDDEELSEFLPGLVATVQADNSQPITRMDADILFDWSKQAVDPRLPIDCDFKTTWRGFLACKDSGKFQLHCFASGKVEIELDGKVVLSEVATTAQWLKTKPIELKFGEHSLAITYSSQPNSKKRLGLYWSGPQFELEPIAPRYLSHRRTDHPQSDFDRGELRGELLSRALRCSSCHEGADTRASLAAPALTHLSDNLRPEWLVARLTELPKHESLPDRRMPYFGLTSEDAKAITVALLASSKKSPEPAGLIDKNEKPPKTKKGEPPPRTEPDVEHGREAFVTSGCVACHRLPNEPINNEPINNDLVWFDGGSLTEVAAKRTANFFPRWLDDPASVNANHRMPQFSLQSLQRADLILYLQSLTANSDSAIDFAPALNKNDAVVNRGKQLIAKYGCAVCHLLPKDLTTKPQEDFPKTKLSSQSAWASGCPTGVDAQKNRPAYSLAESDRRAVQSFWVSAEATKTSLAKIDGAQLLREQNCLACHARDANPGLAPRLNKLVETEPTLAGQLAASIPPAITGVGDKLHTEALKSALQSNQRRRPWLTIQMPKFRLSDSQSELLIDHLIAHDRIPDLPAENPQLPSDKATELAAARLVTSDGFGCQSCHKIGSVDPPPVPINARGTDLTMLEKHIRPTWFRRWIHNPSRIVPRMEMPAIQVAAKGVLHDDLPLQIEALWHTLNTKGFEPPKPNPVRVVRSFNAPDLREPAKVLTDVLETPRVNYLRPLIVGLPNRTNVLIDLERGQLASWWLGDTARQYTRGKSWYWEAGSHSLVDSLAFIERLQVRNGSKNWLPKTDDQFVIRFDGMKHIELGVQWRGAIELRDDKAIRHLPMTQTIEADQQNALKVTTTLDVADGDEVIVELDKSVELRSTDGNLTASLGKHSRAKWSSDGDQLSRIDKNHFVVQSSNQKQLTWQLQLTSELAADVFPAAVPVESDLQPIAIDSVPGFDAIRLPLPTDEMPTAMAWSKSSEMFIASLKGKVLRVFDKNKDGLLDSYEAISDDLPAPYGIAVNSTVEEVQSIDVLCKTGLVRLKRPETALPTGTPYEMEVVADGWGYTADYHDWAVGLPRDEAGCYYVALPCQQDERSEAAAKWRGSALKLVPYESSDPPRKYRVEVYCAGLRFPMGLALTPEGNLFASDNQGNYNPFNEINHLRFGKRYGFINKLENKPGFAPPLESPAINLPHPWTRSVNGVCFIPDDVPRYGALAGQMIGCEYNGLCLVRMSLQKVNGEIQGAAYQFSKPIGASRSTFEGPICCEVSPSGDLYVGNLHDSGWGGGQNTGSIVRLVRAGELPIGIARVKATAIGLTVDFTQPVDREKAMETKSYNVRSYRRVSTPAYGGDDQDEKREPVRSVSISQDGRRADLQLNDLREGCVYEINIAAIGPSSDDLLPNQAHYNMRSVPKE